MYNNEKEDKKKRKKRTYLDRLKAMPGGQQAYMLAMKSAMFASMGEDGEIDEKKEYDLKLKLSKKVAELWELSPLMGQYLINRWVFNRGDELGYEILYAGEIPSEISDINNKLAEHDAWLIDEKQVIDKHIYLDVTGLSYKDLKDAYKAIVQCRTHLGIEFKDIRKGAPESIDYIRALLAARSEDRGLSRKEIAKLLDFKIYTQDIPSGTYPLFQKYLKIGRYIMKRLNKLEDYIYELTGIEQGYL